MVGVCYLGATFANRYSTSLLMALPTNYEMLRIDAPVLADRIGGSGPAYLGR